MDLTLVNAEWLHMSVAQRRIKLMEFQEACLEQAEETGIELETKHYFCNGIYAREITIPQDVALVGEIHKEAQINIISKGSITVVNELGLTKIKAPHTFISSAGIKRIGYTEEETVWTTIHATELTNVDDIKEKFIVPDFNTLDKLQAEKKHGLGSDSSSSSRCNSSDS